MRPQTICWCGKSRRHVLTATVVLLHFMFAAHVLAGPVFLHMRASSIRQAFDSKIDVNIVSENLLRQNLRGETMVLAKADNNDIYLSGITANGAVQLIRLGSNGSIAWSTTFGIESLSNQGLFVGNEFFYFNLRFILGLVPSSEMTEATDIEFLLLLKCFL